MSLILDQLVIELSKDFAVFDTGYPVMHESCPVLSNCERYFTNPLLESPENPLLQAKSQERGSNNMAASFQDPKKVVRVRTDFGQSLFQDVYMFVWSDRADQLPIKSSDSGCVLAARLAHNDIFFKVVHAGKILF